MFLYFFFRGEISALFSCASSPSESLSFFVLNLDSFFLFSGLLVFRCSSCRLIKSPWLLLPLLNFLGDLIGDSSGLPSLILRLFCRLFIFLGDSSNDSEYCPFFFGDIDLDFAGDCFSEVFFLLLCSGLSPSLSSISSFCCFLDFTLCFMGLEFEGSSSSRLVLLNDLIGDVRDFLVWFLLFFFSK